MRGGVVRCGGREGGAEAWTGREDPHRRGEDASPLGNFATEGTTMEYTHEHIREHGCDRAPVTDGARRQALLRYMIDRNEHHCEELAELLDGLEGAPRRKLLEAIGSFEAANVQLREVLELLEEGK